MDQYLQLSNQTKADRFPKVFTTVKKLYPEPKEILSFGCSSGEECFTLENYFPDANITGIELNSWVLNQAKNANKSEKIKFFKSLKDAEKKYDIVFCMMVLFSMWEPVKKKDVEKTISEIDEAINTGGLLVAYTTEYRLSKILNNYEVVREWSRIHDRNKKRYYCGYYKKL